MSTTLLNGGRKNKVVEWHPEACQVCGFYGVPADVQCNDCGLRWHRECLHGSEVCEMCHGAPRQGRGNDKCALCLQPDPVVDRPDATDRLVKVRIPDGNKVVHAWCARALLGNAWTKEDVVALLNAPTRLAKGGYFSCASRGTFKTHKCEFCGTKRGFTTFCMYHLTKKAGCTRCRDRPEAYTFTQRAFHPSCAVWAGMQRICRRNKDDAGMVCERNKQYRARACYDARQCLDFTSGVNECLEDAVALDATDFVIPDGVPLKGQRFSSLKKKRRA